MGGAYATHVRLLCGNWLRGGSLDLQARSGASRGSGFAVSGKGLDVDLAVKGLGARPVAPPFRQRAPRHSRLILVRLLPSLLSLCLS